MQPSPSNTPQPRAIANLTKAGLKPATDTEKSPQRLDFQCLRALVIVRSRIYPLLLRSSRLSCPNQSNTLMRSNDYAILPAVLIYQSWLRYCCPPSPARNQLSARNHLPLLARTDHEPLFPRARLALVYPARFPHMLHYGSGQPGDYSAFRRLVHQDTSGLAAGPAPPPVASRAGSRRWGCARPGG